MGNTNLCITVHIQKTPLQGHVKNDEAKCEKCDKMVMKHNVKASEKSGNKARK